MSDAIKHECGIALLRLKKPLQFYTDKYGTSFYGLNKMYLLMEKEHNRGQDGAGLANIKLDPLPGKKYISRIRSNDQQPVREVFAKAMNRFNELGKTSPEKLKDAEFLKSNYAFTGEVFLGHLRYGTYGGNSIENCHPFLRQNNWMTRNLVLAGNFNLTNVDELFGLLVELGQHPKERTDTVTVMEKIGHFIDEENQKLFDMYHAQGYSNQQISDLIAKNIDIQKVLQRASKDWDGGYAMAGMLGHGDAFVYRDPQGIRPAYYYEDEEVCVVASERPPIQSAFNVPLSEIKEIPAGCAYIIKKDGASSIKEIKKSLHTAPCSFERIYFSRGNDADIYAERQALGQNIVPQLLKEVNYDLDKTVFSFIPNTAETAFYGMIKALEDHLNDVKIEKLTSGTYSKEEIESIIRKRARIEKIAIKDVKMRTFITQDSARDEMVGHVYDVTYGTVKSGVDSLVVIDDSIVRGTTLKKSIIKMLDRLGPKRIIIASSAPQIRYPDCYGIDMAKMGDFIAFQACVALLRERNLTGLLDEVYLKCKEQENAPKETVKNYVQEVYKPFTDEEISSKIAELVTPEGAKAKITVIFQKISGLHEACPNNQGDWYFSGKYPTPGGNKVVNKAFINYIEGKQGRAY
ncbi:MAG: amidophosphoribosyltransferase [Bacteroidetes bacterium]|nr:amidophosphoribosyltransferase [Bacteroidota bacterium]